MKISSFFITVAAFTMLIWLWNTPRNAQPSQNISSQPVAPSEVVSSYLLPSVPPASPLPASASSPTPFSSSRSLPPASTQNFQNSTIAQHASATPSSSAKKEAPRPPQTQNFSPPAPAAPPAPLPGSPADLTASLPASSNQELENETIELPADLPLPAVFVAPSSPSPLPPPVAAKQEEIAQVFLDEILSNSNPTEEGDAEISDDSWHSAKASADHLFKILYGDAAYNQRSLQATLQSGEQP